MKTLNEQVAEVMGFECNSSRFKVYDFIEPKTRLAYWANSWEFAKLLQARMVQDGWTVCNYHSPTFGHSSRAGRDPVEFPDFNMAESDDVVSEPLSIFDLFCKVYSLEAK
jgi:hypothetical protein